MMVNVVRLLKITTATLAVAFLASCSAKKGETSSIKIVLPTSSSLNTLKAHNKAFSQNVSAMTFDSSKDCFAINVTGPSIPQVANSCAPAVGVFSGFKAGGTTVTLEVPMGSARKLEVFYFQRALSTDVCPSNFSALTPDKVALLGAVAGIEMNQPETLVTVNVTAPGANDNLVTQSVVAASCVAVAAPVDPSAQRLVLGAKRSAMGGGYTIEGQVTSIRTMNELSSPSGHKMFLGPKGL